ncbi:MAG TPA: ATP-binding protein [Dokdonella sp.]|uniref:ATP-binding protein n=1 Tax=Dokdonella sp. TaxID=2291710 RepID=UPI002D804E8B|nr:ATP-binding protein [Dokdonella sp.]HET9032408.1 ATP-binding protein [Dokdonella sp.]
MIYHDGRTWPHGPRQLVSTLAWLRLCAIGGQTLTIIFVADVLKLAIPIIALLAGVGVLAVFSLVTFWRLHQQAKTGVWEPVIHIAIDTLVLGYLLYLSGGASNPFIFLLVMPITLAATALPLRSVTIVAVLSVATYLLLMHFHVPLPEVGDRNSVAGFGLHLTGMAISFAITAGMLGFFIARLARALRAQQADAELERQRALRDEGILAIATQAASTAHELNTPLSTIRTLLGELSREHATEPALKDDLNLLIGQAERCRDILKDLVKVGSNQLTGIAEWVTVKDLCKATRDAFALLRPEAEAHISIDEGIGKRRIAVVPALHHAVVNLLNNAADASLANADPRVEMRVSGSQDILQLDVRDFGKGMNAAVRPKLGLRFETTKSDGLGLGLALANATAERFGGTLVAAPAEGGGTRQRLRLPLATLDNPQHER